MSWTAVFPPGIRPATRRKRVRRSQTRRQFKASFSADKVRDFAAVGAALHAGEIVVDARSGAALPRRASRAASGPPVRSHAGRSEPPLRPPLRRGRLIAPDKIRELFEQAGVDLSTPVTTTCGSGITAAVLLFALARIGKHDVALYDGSWTDWASGPARAIATGPA